MVYKLKKKCKIKYTYIITTKTNQKLSFSQNN